jgi:hypothetical protein
MTLDDPLCADTLHKAASLARMGANAGPRRLPDGMAHLGARSARSALFADVEATADQEDQRRR